MLYANRTKVHNLVVNGIVIDTAYINGHVFFRREIELELPQFTTEINLQEFIEQNAQPNIFAYTIVNNLVQPRIVTGDLSGLSVTLINNGEIQGIDANRTALEVTSPLMLINNGVIRGGGGDGGAGGKGGNDTTTTRVYYSPSSWGDTGIWDRYRNCIKGWIAWYNGVQVAGDGPAPYSVKVGGVTLYRTDEVTAARREARCPNEPHTLGYKSYILKTVTRIGGAGGAGGRGQSFGLNPTYGQPGADSTPPGGNKGGAGGAGGKWGENGSPGSPGINGEPGQLGDPAGYAIRGIDMLQVGSKTGELVGPTITSRGIETNDGGVTVFEEYPG